MSGEPIEELLIKISADMSGLVATMQKTGQVVEQLAGHMGDAAEKHISHGFFKAELAVEAFKKALEFVKEQTIDAVKEQYEHVDALTVMSERTGVATESLVAMEHVGEKVHISLQDMDVGLRKMQVSMSAAADRTSDARTALEYIGLDFKELKRLAPEEQMVAVSKAIAAIKDPADRTAIAVELMGRSGAKVVEAMKNGLEDAKKETEGVGLAFSKIDGEKVRAANLAIREMKKLWEGIATQLAIESAPYLTSIAESLKHIVGETHGFKNAIHVALEDTVIGVGYAADALQGFQIMWSSLKVVVTTLGQSIYLIFDGITKVIGLAAVAIGNIFGDVFDVVGQTAAGILNKLADGVSYFSDETAGYMRKLAEGMSNTSSTMSANITAAVAGAGADLVDFGDRQLAQANAAADLARADLAETLNKPIPHDAVIEWGKEVVETADAAGKQAKMSLDAALGLLDQGGGGGGDKGSLQDAKDRKGKLDELRKAMEDETQVEMEAYWDRNMLIRKALDAKEIEAEDANALREEEEKRHQLAMANLAVKNMDKIQTAEQLRRKNAVTGTKQMFGDLSTLMNSHSRAAFEVGKAAAIANATISGIEAAVHAWKWGMETGGPYVAAAFTAASVAATAVQIGQIASQSFGGGGGGSSSFSGGVPAVTTAPQQGSGQNGGASGKFVNITLQGEGGYTRKQVEDMIQGIGEAVGDGVILRTR